MQHDDEKGLVHVSSYQTDAQAEPHPQLDDANRTSHTLEAETKEVNTQRGSTEGFCMVTVLLPIPACSIANVHIAMSTLKPYIAQR